MDFTLFNLFSTSILTYANFKHSALAVQVHAIDMDSGDNGEVRYELKKGHGELFKVCRKTGEISLKQNLEGHNREYQLTIAAYDGGKFVRNKVKIQSQ